MKTMKKLCFTENLFYNGYCQNHNGDLYVEFINEIDKRIFRKVYKGKPYDFIKYKGVVYYLA